MGSVSSSDLAKVQSYAKRVANLKPRGATEIAVVAFMAGALYSLTRSIQFRFDDSRMKSNLVSEASELAKVIERICASKEPPTPWLSGYFIDSAMWRIHSLADRLGKLVGPSKPLESEVPNAVNKMKHEPDAGIGVGWDVRFRHVIRDVGILLPLLEKAVPGSRTEAYLKMRRLAAARRATQRKRRAPEAGR